MPPLDPTRKDRITASMVPTLLSGDAAAIQRLYLRAIGDPRYEDDGFSSSWPARFGLLVEPLALDFFAEKHGCEFIERGVQRFHPRRAFVSATLDAVRVPGRIATNVKCVNNYRDWDDVARHYAGQCVVEQECARAEGAALLVVKGGNEPVELPIEIDDDFRAEVWRAVDEFETCIETLTPPFELQFPRIVPVEQWREINLDDADNFDEPNWGGQMRQLLAAWDETHDAAQTHEKVKASIKEILPDDCGKLICAGVRITRARNNSVTIRRGA